MDYQRNCLLSIIMIATTALACHDSETNPVSPGTASVSPLCQLGCVETDPNPSAPGVFLGGVTPTECFEFIGTDADQDMLGDFCENQLSWAFRPELFYWYGDNVGREPHWVARPTPSDGVMIGYLLSYYRDEGSDAWPCHLFWAPASCFGHNGDSEAIFLEVYYDPTTKHWVLDRALYSQHGQYPSYGRGTNAYPTQFFTPPTRAPIHGRTFHKANMRTTQRSMHATPEANWRPIPARTSIQRRKSSPVACSTSAAPDGTPVARTA